MPRGETTERLKIGFVEPPSFEQTKLTRLATKSLRVRPLRSPFERALILAILALGFGTLALIFTFLRTDLSEVSWTVTYGSAFIELLAGAAVFWLAMRWSVPGSGAKYSRSSLFIGAAMVLALGAALAAPHLVAPGHPGLRVGSDPAKGLPCLGWQLLVAVPVFLISLWFILRGAAVSSVLAGALAGLGADLLSDAAVHLHCPAVDPTHTVTWHLGAMALLTALGAIIGKAMPKW